jgi:ribosome-associated protein
LKSTRPAAATGTEDLARKAVALCLDVKARDMVVLDLHGVTDMTDYFVIASGTSDTHVRAVAQHVIDGMQAAGVPVMHVEGMAQGRWVLLDFVDFVVHVFHPAMREFYQLERLWSDAKMLGLEPQGAAS